MNHLASDPRPSHLVRAELTQLEAYLNGLPDGLQHGDAFSAYRRRRSDLNLELELSVHREQTRQMIERMEWRNRIWVLAASAAIMGAITVLQFVDSPTAGRVVGGAGVLITLIGFGIATLKLRKGIADPSGHQPPTKV